MTLDELEKVLPDAAIEILPNGEIVVYTGWALDPDKRDAPLVTWCEVCDSGKDVPEDGCGECERVAGGASDE